MASTKAYRDYILEQLSNVPDVTCRPMMGEYLLYIISQNAYAASNNITHMKEPSTIFLFSPEQDNKDLPCQ